VDNGEPPILNVDGIEIRRVYETGDDLLSSNMYLGPEEDMLGENVMMGLRAIGASKGQRFINLIQQAIIEEGQHPEYLTTHASKVAILGCLRF
jgi:hypothetical protein